MCFILAVQRKKRTSRRRWLRVITCIRWNYYLHKRIKSYAVGPLLNNITSKSLDLNWRSNHLLYLWSEMQYYLRFWFLFIFEYYLVVIGPLLYCNKMVQFFFQTQGRTLWRPKLCGHQLRGVCQPPTRNETRDTQRHERVFQKTPDNAPQTSGGTVCAHSRSSSPQFPLQRRLLFVHS